MREFCARFDEIVPFEAAAEPGAPTTLEDGATLTLQLPLRGHVQVRVEQVDERAITLAPSRATPSPASSASSLPIGAADASRSP
jgi:hypothetical protein